MCPAGAYGAYQTFTQYVQEVHSIEPTGGPIRGYNILWYNILWAQQPEIFSNEDGTSANARAYIHKSACPPYASRHRRLSSLVTPVA